MYKDLWDTQFSREATEEIERERNRTYIEHIGNGCEDDTIDVLMLTNRLKFFNDSKCEQQLNSTENKEEYEYAMEQARLMFG